MLGRLRCYAASRPSAHLSSLTGPSLTGGAAIQSGKFLTNFLEQRGDGDDSFGVCGDDRGDDDEVAAGRRPLPQRQISGGERRVLRQARSKSTAAGTAGRSSCAASRPATQVVFVMCPVRVFARVVAQAAGRPMRLDDLDSWTCGPCMLVVRMYSN